MDKYKFSQKEIDEIKKEYSKKKQIRSNKFVNLDDRTAALLLEYRKRFDDYINSIHSSHNMTDWYSEIKSQVGTERFYRIRKCKECDREQYYHGPRMFIDSSLKHRCLFVKKLVKKF